MGRKGEGAGKEVKVLQMMVKVIVMVVAGMGR